MSSRVGAIVGPTAVGKTEAAVAVAPFIGAEIVSIDSMQLYRGMDIGTAKPTASMQALVPHHLIDLFEPNQEVTVSDFQTLARGAITAIADREQLPLLVGGSGLYFRAVVDDLRFPPRRAPVRSALEQELETSGAEALYQRLVELDPRAAAKIEAGNSRRIVRALEVIEITGRPFSENDTWDRFESIYELRVAGLRLPRSELYARVENRIDKMLEEGLIEEVRRLQRNRLGRSASQALGYRQVLDAPGGADTDQIRTAVVTATKRFVRRQESWFRSDPRVVWFDASSSTLVAELTDFFQEVSSP